MEGTQGSCRPGWLFDRVIEHLETLGREPTTIFRYRDVADVTEQAIVGSSSASCGPITLERFYEELLRSRKSAA